MKKKFSILGLGQTGLASALFLKRKGYEVFVSDAQTSVALEKRAETLKKEGISFELGKHSPEKVGECDWALVSPGIPPTSEIYRLLTQKKVPMVSELEVASWHFTGEIIAVTGTSGKTTVTTLIDRILKANGLASVSSGNIGNPWIGELEQMKPETHVVLEASSFQLLHTYSLRPQIGILINLGLNHLDWHPTMDHYVAAKLRLFQSQKPEDMALIRAKDREDFFPDYPFKAKVFHVEEEGKNFNEALLYQFTKLKNLDPSKTKPVLDSFEGLEHRLERVGVIEGVSFVNDSKCTTLEALTWGLEQFPDKKIVLLAGGHAKANDFRPIRDLLSKKLKQAIVFGEARELLWENWAGAAPLLRAADLKEAFETAKKSAQPGDVVLLSPACASFDQYSNYKERGEHFKKLVAESHLADVKRS